MTMAFCEARCRQVHFVEGRVRGSVESQGIIGMSGPRDMNQAEQTLNLEIRCRRTKATYCGQRGERTSKYTFAITILDPRARFSPSFAGRGTPLVDRNSPCPMPGICIYQILIVRETECLRGRQPSYKIFRPFESEWPMKESVGHKESTELRSRGTMRPLDGKMIVRERQRERESRQYIDFSL